MYLPILTPIFEIIGSLGGSWIEKQKVIAEGSIAIARARAEAKAHIQITKATAEIEWEKTMAQASEGSWKDELWTIFFVLILVLSFIPGMDPYIQQGFDNIATLPDWFGYAVMLAISAAFGKNIVKDFTSLANNRQPKVEEKVIIK
jgi:hypothetical protein